MRLVPVLLLGLLVACGSNAGDGGLVDAGGGEMADAANQADAMSCEQTDLMIVLDRSGSLAQRPDGSMPPNTPEGALETKWYAAITTIESVVAAYQDTVRFGLTMFPSDPEGEEGRDCSNLETWLIDYLPPETDNRACEPAEVAVPAGQASLAAIDGAIELMDTGLCLSTPIGAGLAAAQASLAAGADGRDQLALLITDGNDTCDGDAGYDTLSLPTADALAAAGVRTYVVGFDGSGSGVSPTHLNDLACAGGTAPDPGQNCVDQDGGKRAIDAPTPAQLFVLAEDQAALTAVLMSIAAGVACDEVE
jgi:hypothetical protein